MPRPFGLCLAVFAACSAVGSASAQGDGAVPAGCEIVPGTLRAAGARVAYVAKRGDAFHPVDGHELLAGKGYDAVEPPVLDRAGEHVLFRAMKRGRDGKETWQLLMDGKEIAEGGWIGPVALDPDGTPAFWVFEDANRIGGCQLRFGKKKSGKWVTGDLDGPPSFLPDGRVLTIATRGGGWSLLSMDEKGKEDDRAFANLVSVVPAGGDVLCTRVRSSASSSGPVFYGLVRISLENGAPRAELGAAYRSAGSPVCSADGARVAFKVLGESGMGVATSDSSETVATPYAFVDELAFAPDGKSLAYLACRDGKIEVPATYDVPAGSGVAVLRAVRATGGKWTVVANEQTSEAFDGAHSLAWSPDGSRVAYAALRDGAWRVVAGERTSEPADEVAALTWTAAGDRVRYVCRDGGAIRWRELALR